MGSYPLSANETSAARGRLKDINTDWSPAEGLASGTVVRDERQQAEEAEMPGLAAAEDDAGSLWAQMPARM